MADIVGGYKPKVIWTDGREYRITNDIRIVHYVEMLNGVYPRIEGRYEIYNGYKFLIKSGGHYPIADFWEVAEYVKKCENNPTWVCEKWIIQEMEKNQCDFGALAK